MPASSIKQTAKPNSTPGNLLLIINAAEGIMQLLLADITQKTPANTLVQNLQRHTFEPAPASAQELAPALAQESPPRLAHPQEGACSCLSNYTLTVRQFQEINAPAQGVEVLIPLLEHMMHVTRQVPARLSHIACVQGPGSFTGVRLGLSTCAGLARCYNSLQAGIDFLWLLALQAALFVPHGACNTPLHFIPVTHARRNLVHAKHYHLCHPPSLETLTPQSDILVVSPTDLAEYAHTLPGRVYLLGSGMAKNPKSLQMWPTLTKQRPVPALRC